MTLTRRGVVAGVTAASLPVWRTAHAAGDDTIPIGCLLPLSGAQQDNGEAILTGAEIAADMINAKGGVKGKRIELVVRDDKANPNTALAGFRELTGGGVKLFIGGTFSAPVLAVLPALVEAKSVFIGVTLITMQITHENFVPNLFRGCGNAWMLYRAEAEVMALNNPGVKVWGLINPDVAYGHDSAAAFAKGVTETSTAAGRSVRVLDPIFVRGDQNDFKLQIAQMLAAGADGVFCGLTGASAITLYSQGRSAGWERQVKAIGDAGLELGIVKAMGRNVPRNIWSGTWWYYGGTTDNALSRTLYEAYVAKTKDDTPRGFVERGFTSVLAYAKAVGVTKTTEAEPVIKALETLELDSPNGPYRFRPEDHQSLCAVGTIGLGPSDKPPGWQVTKFQQVKGQDIVEPASPGRAFVDQ